MNNKGRPLTQRKKVQIMVAFTVLAWATQTLLAQWSRGAETAFVPRDGAGALGSATLELRAEARVFGAEVTIRELCRWSDADAAMFAPVADVVVTRLAPRRPYKVLGVGDVRKLLEEAGVNVALVRFSGPVECTVARADVELSEGEALDQWIKAQEATAGAGTGAPVKKKDARPIPKSIPVAAKDPAKAELVPSPIARHDDGVIPEPEGRTLRKLLTADLAVRLALPEDQIVLSFDPRDEAALTLSEPQFKFNLSPRHVRGLGDVSWDVTIVGSATGAGARDVQLRGTARAWQNQVVLARPAARRQVIREADVTQRRTLVDELPDDTLLKPEQIVGQMAARDLKPGTLLTARLVDAVPLAKVGQFITVTLERGTVRIKSVAKALEGGSYGQVIRVKNEATRDVYQVVLTGPQEASMAMPTAEDKGVASASK